MDAGSIPAASTKLIKLKKLKKDIWKNLNLKELLLNERGLLLEMQDLFMSRNCGGSDFLKYLGEDSDIWCMFKQEKLAGFAWLCFDEGFKHAELCWLATDKKLKGLESKKLFDKVVRHCEQIGVHTISFNCFEPSWKNIKDKTKLFERFGYTLIQDNNYDMVISLKEKGERLKRELNYEDCII